MAKNPVRENGVVWEELDGEALVVNPATKSSWLLNPTATLIWRHCTGAHGLTELARALARTTGAEARKVEREAVAFCRRLQQAGLLRSSEAAAYGTAPMAFAGLNSYSAPDMLSRGLTAGSRRRPTPRGNSGPG
jgi:hypothetical protein